MGTDRQLLNCPFCGGAPIVKRVGNEHTRKRAVHIACSTFGCTIEMRVATLGHDFQWCEDHAAAKWNRRTI